MKMTIAKRDAKWWRCICGAYLPESPTPGGGVVSCPRCGRLWAFGFWALNRWVGDSGATSLVPRNVAGPTKEPDEDQADEGWEIPDCWDREAWCPRCRSMVWAPTGQCVECGYYVW